MGMTNEKPKSILVVDDHPVFRAGLVALLARLDGNLVVTEAGSVAEAWEALSNAPPTCALLDVQLGDGNGLTLLRRARAHGFATRFIIVSLFDDELLRRQARALGASAFVPKARDGSAVVDAVRDVLATRTAPPVNPALEEPVGLEKRVPLLEAVSRLSPAERLVLVHVSMNRTSPDIARRLGLSPRTVQNHRAHICEKLGLRGNNKLLEVALELKDVLGSEG